MKRIEALALVIAKYSGGFDPEDAAFRLCNPGRLQVYSRRLLPTMADGGLRTFASWMNGMRGLIFDLTVKCDGRSRTHIKPDATLEDLLGMWGMVVIRKAVLFLRRALEDEEIDGNTPIGWFVRDMSGKSVEEEYGDVEAKEIALGDSACAAPDVDSVHRMLLVELGKSRKN